jgi:hypothetical protein
LHLFSPEGLAAEDRLRAILFYENIPHKRSSRREDQDFKIDLWIWHMRREGWVKTQVTISNDPDVFGPKLQECQLHHVVYLALDRKQLIRAVERPQSNKAIQVRRELVDRIFRTIDEWLEHDPDAISPICQLP